MSTKIKVTPGRGLRIQREGKFDQNKLIEEIIEILKSLEYEVQKKKYQQKIKDPGFDIDYRLIAEREITDFYKFEIAIKMFFQYYKAKKDYLDIQINSTLIADYKENWETSRFKKALLSIYLNYIKKDEAESYWGKLYGETEKIRTKIKSSIK